MVMRWLRLRLSDIPSILYGAGNGRASDRKAKRPPAATPQWDEAKRRESGEDFARPDGRRAKKWQG